MMSRITLALKRHLADLAASHLPDPWKRTLFGDERTSLSGAPECITLFVDVSFTYTVDTNGDEFPIWHEHTVSVSFRSTVIDVN